MPQLFVQGMGRIPKRTIRQPPLRHGNKEALLALNDSEIPYHKNIIKGDAYIGLDLVLLYGVDPSPP